MRRVVCGVPKEYCCGGEFVVNYSAAPIKAHQTSGEAFACYRRYLVSILGYKQVGPREFSPPDGGPIRVLTKRSRFGGQLRGGKHAEGQRQTDRGNPKDRGAGGLIVSC